MPSLLRGLPGDEALHRLLALSGVDVSLQALRESLRGGSRPENLVEAARRLGLQGREIHLAVGDLALISLPALVCLSEGGWVVVRAQASGRFDIEDGSGHQLRTMAELEALHQGLGLEVARPVPRGHSLLAMFASEALRHRPALLRLLGATVLLQFLALITPQFTRLALDRALPEAAYSLLGLVTLGMVLVALFQAWTGWLRQQTILYLESRLERPVGQVLLSSLLALPYPFLASRRLGELTQAFFGLEAARGLLMGQVFGAVLDGCMAMAYLVLMIAVFPTMAGVVVAAAVVLLALSAAVAHFQGRAQEREVEVRLQARGYLAEIIRGIATIKAAGAEGSAATRWMDLLEAVRGLSLRRLRLGLWTDLGLDAVRQVTLAAVLIWGGRLVLDGQAQIGSLMAFIQMGGAFLLAVVGVGDGLLAFRQAQPQMAEANRILSMEPEPRPPEQHSTTLAGPVLIENIWFRYDADRPWVFKGYSLHLEPGERHWLQAPSGFGKSTLLRLLAGLYPPNQGSISIGGLKPQDARHLMVYLPQFVNLYGGSVKENLLILSHGAPFERLAEAAEASGLSDLVASLPMGYDTILPHGGASFSGGQRQLIALTAVMASDRPFLLLDEAMANLDSLRQARIQDHPFFESKTILYASHNVAFSAADASHR